MISKNADKIIQGLFDSLLRGYQAGLEQFMKGSNFVYDYIHEMHYKFYIKH